MPKKGNHNISSLGNLILDSFEKKFEDNKMPNYIPTGAMEPAIVACGKIDGVAKAVNLQCSNKLGKTAVAAVILRNIIWEHDPIYFDYPLYKDWAFKNTEYDDKGNITKLGEPIKRIRIVCTAKNAADNGPIMTEIKKWWPEGRYTKHKAGKTYYSVLKSIDTKWEVDILTFEMDKEQFEGPMISFHWIDEPPKPDLMGAFTSRMTKGGILLFTQTPLNAGPFISVLDDLKEKGYEVQTINAEIYDNDVKTGKLNSKKTKRGLMTSEEISTWVAGVPPDQVEARVFGRCVGKSGVVFKDFSAVHHVRDLDFVDPRFQNANCYMAMDPHPKYYPFIQWWAVLPPNANGKSLKICYNEWPMYSDMNDYYDNIRHSVQFDKTPNQMTKIINAFDLSQLGFQVVKRGLDPHYEDVIGLSQKYAAQGLELCIPKREKIKTHRDTIRMAQQWNKGLSMSIYNEPEMFVMPHCINTTRAFTRHYWDTFEKAKHGMNVEIESEKYKDPIDCTRIFLAMLDGKDYQPRFNNKIKIVKKKYPETQNPCKPIPEGFSASSPHSKLKYYTFNKNLNAQYQ